MPNKISQFWQELKRRNVIRVVTVYAGAAFVIIELINNIAEPLRLPDWTPTLVIVLLAIGFPLVIIFSWIYDLHPEGGMVKTEPGHKANDEVSTSYNGWKIASYISFVVIVGLIVLNILPRSGNEEILDKSIAVLPFQNDSPDQEMYFINGAMEEILDNLCKIEDLRVVSRSSVEQYRDNPKPIPTVAEEMKVSYVLEGSGQRDGDKIRLTVQLLDGRRDQHIWSESYIREIRNIFELQSEIAQLVAVEIKAVITPDEKDLIETIPTTNLTAYDYYQQADQELMNDNLDRAEELYYKALEYDGMYADAYVGLARIYWRKNYWQTIFEEDFMDSALNLANKALRIDDRLSDAYLIRGNYNWQNDQIDRAIEELDRAIEFNPNNGWAYVFGGSLYAQIDIVKSLQYYHKALALNRGDQLPGMLDNMGWAYLQPGFIEKSRYYYTEAFKLTRDSAHYYDRLRICEFVNEDFPLAIEYLKKSYALDSTDTGIHSYFGEYYMLNRDYVQSLKHYKRWMEESSLTGQNAVFGMHRIGWAYWMNGFKEEGRAFFLKQIDYCNHILEMGRVIGTTYRNYYDLAATYAFMGEKEKAFLNLSTYKKYLKGDRWGVMYFNNDPLFDPIRDEPVFQQMVHDVEAKYQAEHERVKQWLEENDML